MQTCTRQRELHFVHSYGAFRNFLGSLTIEYRQKTHCLISDYVTTYRSPVRKRSQMYSPKRRMLQAFNSIEDENLRALSAELVQIYSESSGDRQPRAAYRAKVDSFARAFGADFSDVITPNELPAEKPDATPSRAGTGLITLRELTLCNFGSYRDVTTIDLSAKDASRNVVVIVGSNGDGKSTLYYALNWALYGDEYLTELERDKGRSLTSLVNRGALEDAAVGNKAVRVSVTLSFQVRNIDYYVTREATVVAGHESAVSPKLEPTRSEEHTSELQSRGHLVCRLLLEKKNNAKT